MKEVDRENVKGRREVLEMKNMMREDVGDKGLGVEEVVKNGGDDKEG